MALKLLRNVIWADPQPITFAGGVENRRSSVSLPVADGATFAGPPESGLAWLCFLFPLIEPGAGASNASGSRRKYHEVAHGELAVRALSWTSPNTSCRAASG
jgi:hypothetical protein